MTVHDGRGLSVSTSNRAWLGGDFFLGRSTLLRDRMALVGAGRWEKVGRVLASLENAAYGQGTNDTRRERWEP